MKVTDLKQLLRISGLAAPLGDTRWVTLAPEPLRAVYDGLHSGGSITASDGLTVEGHDRPVTVDARLVGSGLDLMTEDEVKVKLVYPNLIFTGRGQRFTVRVSDAGAFEPVRLTSENPTMRLDPGPMLGAVRYLSQIVGGPQGAPVLTGIRLVGHDDGLLLEATDGVGAGRAWVPGKAVTGTFAAVVPGADLLAALEVVDGPAAAMRTDGRSLHVFDKVATVRVATLADAAKYPDLSRLPLDGYDYHFELPSAAVVAAAQASLLMHSQRVLDLTAVDGKLRFTVREQELGSYELALGRIDTPDFSMKLDAEYLKLAGLVGDRLTIDAGHAAHKLVMLTGATGWRYWITEVR